jgi:hypothetical protein
LGLFVFAGSPESSVANVLLLRWSKVERPSIGCAALHRAVGAFTNWNVVKHFGANSAQNLGKALVDSDLVGSHAFSGFIERLLGFIEQFDVDFSALAPNYGCGLAEHFLGLNFTIELCFEL